jgi:hypothetical protein
MRPIPKRLLVYVVNSAGTFAASGITVGMCGDGTLSWSEFRWHWMIFVALLVVNVSGAIRAFWDQTIARQNPGAVFNLPESPEPSPEHDQP